MCEFKKGDKVICINTDNHSELIKNKIYEVEKPNGDFVYLKGCKYGYFTFLFRKECKCCEYIKDLQEIEDRHEEIPEIKHIIKARITTITRRKGIRRDVGVIDWKAFPLNYCPMCGRKLAEDGRKGSD